MEVKRFMEVELSEGCVCRGQRNEYFIKKLIGVELGEDHECRQAFVFNKKLIGSKTVNVYIISYNRRMLYDMRTDSSQLMSTFMHTPLNSSNILKSIVCSIV